MLNHDDWFDPDYETRVELWEMVKAEDDFEAEVLQRKMLRRNKENYARIARNHFSDHSKLLHVGIVPAFICAVSECVSGINDLPHRQRELRLKRLASVAHLRVFVTDPGGGDVGEIHLGMEEEQGLGGSSISIFMTASNINSAVENALNGFYQNWDASIPPRRTDSGIQSTDKLSHVTFWMDLCLDISTTSWGFGFVDEVKIGRAGGASSALTHLGYREVHGMFSEQKNKRRASDGSHVDYVTYRGRQLLSSAEFDKGMVRSVTTCDGKQILALTHVTFDIVSGGGQ